MSAAASPRPKRVGFLNQKCKSDKILSETQLKGMENHKYASEGVSILDPLMQIFWNFVVNLVPLWVAPNLITITGLVLNAIGGILLFIYFPSASDQNYKNNNKTSKVPDELQALFLVKAITLFLYQTLDAIDGKQARRTGTSSPLGELFDHGMDSISCALVGVSMMIMLNAGNEPDLILVFMILISSAFYLAHWGTYITGKLQFSYFDVTEAQLFSIGLLLVTFACGQGFWDLLFIPGASFPLRYIIYLSLLLNFCFRLKTHLDIVIAGGAGRNGSTVADTSVIGPVQPLLFLTLLIVLIHFGDISLIKEFPVLFSTTFALCYSKISNRLIVAHMSKTELEKTDSCFVAMLAILLNIYFGSFIQKRWMLILSLIYVIFDLLYYMTNVYKEIADHLDINVFTIPYKKDEPEQSNATAKEKQTPESTPAKPGMKLRSRNRRD